MPFDCYQYLLPILICSFCWPVLRWADYDSTPRLFYVANWLLLVMIPWFDGLIIPASLNLPLLGLQMYRSSDCLPVFFRWFGSFVTLVFGDVCHSPYRFLHSYPLLRCSLFEFRCRCRSSAGTVLRSAVNTWCLYAIRCCVIRPVCSPSACLFVPAVRLLLIVCCCYGGPLFVGRHLPVDSADPLRYWLLLRCCTIVAGSVVLPLRSAIPLPLLPCRDLFIQIHYLFYLRFDYICYVHDYYVLMLLLERLYFTITNIVVDLLPPYVTSSLIVVWFVLITLIGVTTDGTWCSITICYSRWYCCWRDCGPVLFPDRRYRFTDRCCYSSTILRWWFFVITFCSSVVHCDGMWCTVTSDCVVDWWCYYRSFYCWTCWLLLLEYFLVDCLLVLFFDISVVTFFRLGHSFTLGSVFGGNAIVHCLIAVIVVDCDSVLFVVLDHICLLVVDLQAGGYWNYLTLSCNTVHLGVTYACITTLGVAVFVVWWMDRFAGMMGQSTFYFHSTICCCRLLCSLPFYGVVPILIYILFCPVRSPHIPSVRWYWLVVVVDTDCDWSHYYAWLRYLLLFCVPVPTIYTCSGSAILLLYLVLQLYELRLLWPGGCWLRYDRFITLLNITYLPLPFLPLRFRFPRSFIVDFCIEHYYICGIITFGRYLSRRLEFLIWALVLNWVRLCLLRYHLLPGMGLIACLIARWWVRFCWYALLESGFLIAGYTFRVTLFNFVQTTIRYSHYTMPFCTLHVRLHCSYTNVITTVIYWLFPFLGITLLLLITLWSVVLATVVVVDCCWTLFVHAAMVPICWLWYVILILVGGDTWCSWFFVIPLLAGRCCWFRWWFDCCLLVVMIRYRCRWCWFLNPLLPGWFPRCWCGIGYYIVVVVCSLLSDVGCSLLSGGR